MKNLQPSEKHLADKLQHVPVPDADQSWEQMRKLLDKEMPRSGGAGWGGNSKWWWMGITVGFIILATWLAQSLTNSSNKIADNKQQENKNTSSTNTNNNNSARKDDNTATLNADNKDVSKPNTTDINTQTDKQAETTSGQNENVSTSTDKNETTVSDNEQKAANVQNLNTVSNNDPKKVGNENPKPTSDKINFDSKPYAAGQIKNSEENKKDKNLVTTRDNKKDQDKGNISKNLTTDQQQIPTTDNITTVKDQDAVAQNKTSTENNVLIDASLVNTNLMLQEQAITPAALFNTAESAEVSSTIIPGKTDKAFLREMRTKGLEPDNRKPRKSAMGGKFGGNERELTFAAGLALPQNVAVSGQHASSFNINAKRNQLLDYLPAPYFQYHLNTKLFLQTEFHFQAPQYTERLLLSKYSFSQGSTQYESNKYLEKLYYFNIPFNIYYSPARNFYIGTGLQYSSLLGGLTTLEEKRTEGQNAPSYKSFTSRFKDDSLSGTFANSEWRYQFDANYYFKRFTLGLRFNQATKDFINRNAINPALPDLQKRNRSFLLYLRFNIWEERRKEAD